MGYVVGQASCTLYVAATPKLPNPGSPPGDNSEQQFLCGGSTSAGINQRTGNVGIHHADPVATRGYPLTCNIHVNSQTVETARAMGNATFTYDMHMMQYTAPGSRTPHWMIVDGDGTRLDFGPASSPPAATAGIFSQFAAVKGGYILSHAGPPENVASAGNFTYQFSPAGLLRQITDPAGNAQNLSYNANGQIAGVVDLNTGKQITFGYTGALITQVVENGGTAVTTLGYQNGLLTSLAVGSANGVATSVNYTYNADGTPATLTRDGDPASVLNFTYTPCPSTGGGAFVMMANENDATHTSHIAYGQPTPTTNAVESTAVTNSYGGTTYYDYDAAGNLLRTTSPMPTGAMQYPILASAYNANLLPTSLTDNSTSATLTYETNGLPASLTNNYGTDTWRFTHNGADLLTSQDSVQAIAGVWERLIYGDANQPHIPTGYTDALNNTWSFAHNAFGQTTQVTPPPGSPTGSSSITYDEQAGSATRGYALSAVDGNGDGVTFDAYDPLGDLLQVSTYPVHGNAAVKNTLTMAYDAAQRLTLLTHPDGKTFQNAYAGRFLDHTLDEAGTQVNYYYCSVCDALLGASGPLGWSVSWGYDGDHQLTSFADAKGHATTYAYGAAGEMTRATLPDMTTTTFLYNNSGLLRQVTNARGASTALAYDGAERIGQITFPTSSQPSLTYAYNTDDTVQSVTDGAGVTTLTYYANGWVQSVVYNYGASGLAPLQELDYGYWPDGSVHTLTWKSGGIMAGTWTYGYDAGGRLTSVGNGWSENTGWAYDGEGKLTGQTNANGTSLSLAYNQARGWPTNVSYSSGGGLLASYALTYDGGANTVGLLTGVAENTGAQVTYGYDALYRLTSDGRTGTNAFTHAYGYDLAGNAQTLNGQAFGTYDAANKFSALAGGSVGYDGDGDTTSATGSSVPAGTWTWDDRSLLLSATSGANTTTYGYGAGGLRVWSQASGAGKTFYVFSGSALLGEVQNGVPAVAYTWGASGLVSERLLGQNKSLWYAYGPQGETRQLTDSSGAVADTYLYSPYGTLLASSGTDANPFHYIGLANAGQREGKMQRRSTLRLTLTTAVSLSVIFIWYSDVMYHRRQASQRLLQAVRRGDYVQCTALLQQGADPNAHYEMDSIPWLLGKIDGFPLGEPLDTTALVEAAALGHTRIVRLLVEQGADVNVKCRYEDTSLEGFDLNRYTALEIAGCEHHSDTVRLLKQLGAKK